MKHIVIIDVDWERSEKIAKQFRPLGCTVTLVWKTNSEEKSKPENVPAECLLLFYHVGDKGEWQKMPKAAHTIYYGGKEPSGDERFPRDSYRINRSITRRSGYPNSDEAKELLEFAEALNRGESPEPPQLLSPRRPLTLLPTLAILCQGYLFLHALRGVEDPVAAKLVECGTERMGWNELLNQRSYQHLLPPDLPRELARVSRPSWWLQPFREMFSTYRGDNDLDFMTLSKAVEDEWNLAVMPRKKKGAAELGGSESWEEKWKRVDKLLEQLNNRPRNDLPGSNTSNSAPVPAATSESKINEAVIAPHLVAEAYCALADALGSTNKNADTELATKTEWTKP